ncbi:MAG: geranylgeranylglyceryl/heptaprenylglyceryl phosphate synthase [Bacteroidales bacterium]
MPVYQQIFETHQKGIKQLAVLIDPEQQRKDDFKKIVQMANDAGAHYIFVGGSLLAADVISDCIKVVRQNTALPVVLFPGSPLQIHPGADAILLLSLISGRNPELLIGQHVIAAPYLRQSGLEIISTGYMIVGHENYTTAQYISNTLPIPSNKPEIAACTAMAGEMLGLKLIYMDAGSGAPHPVNPEMIRGVKASVSIPLIVGGGINTPEKALAAAQAGADLLVIGNALEKDPALIHEIIKAVKRLDS